MRSYRIADSTDEIRRGTERVDMMGIGALRAAPYMLHNWLLRGYVKSLEE